MTRVGITILAYRSGDTIEEAVRSAIGQDHDGPVDVFVREQGDDDDERRLLERLADDLRSTARQDRRLSIEHGPNLGFAGGHNRLMERLDDDTAAVLLLNADARLEPGFLRAALRALDEPDVGAVQGRVLRPDDGGAVIDTTGLTVARSRRVAGRGQGRRAAGLYTEPGEVFGADGAVALYRRAALDDVAVPGPAGREILASTFFAYNEDVDLAWRLRWRGWRTAYVPAAVAWHRRSAQERPGSGWVARVRDRRRMPAVARRLGWANDRLVRLRVEPIAGIGSDIVPMAARELASFAVLVSRPADVVPALSHLARGLRPAWRARRWTLARRRGTDPRTLIGAFGR